MKKLTIHKKRGLLRRILNNYDTRPSVHNFEPNYSLTKVGLGMDLILSQLEKEFSISSTGACGCASEQYDFLYNAIKFLGFDIKECINLAKSKAIDEFLKNWYWSSQEDLDFALDFINNFKPLKMGWNPACINGQGWVQDTLKGA